jgi:hypothetical protein
LGNFINRTYQLDHPFHLGHRLDSIIFDGLITTPSLSESHGVKFGFNADIVINASILIKLSYILGHSAKNLFIVDETLSNATDYLLNHLLKYIGHGVIPTNLAFDYVYI